jgi:hypothetical protein
MLFESYIKIGKSLDHYTRDYWENGGTQYYRYQKKEGLWGFLNNSLRVKKDLLNRVDEYISSEIDLFMMSVRFFFLS